jgi:hypothetical protein
MGCACACPKGSVLQRGAPSGSSDPRGPQPGTPLCEDLCSCLPCTHSSTQTNNTCRATTTTKNNNSNSSCRRRRRTHRPWAGPCCPSCVQLQTWRVAAGITGVRVLAIPHTGFRCTAVQVCPKGEAHTESAHCRPHQLGATRHLLALASMLHPGWLAVGHAYCLLGGWQWFNAYCILGHPIVVGSGSTHSAL